MMDEVRALLLADPSTREQALGEYARNSHLRSGTLEVACETLGAAYKRVSAERDAAVKIAAHIMQENGICRYDDTAKCRRSLGLVTGAVCEKCLAGVFVKRKV